MKRTPKFLVAFAIAIITFGSLKAFVPREFQNRNHCNQMEQCDSKFDRNHHDKPESCHEKPDTIKVNTNLNQQK